MQQSLTNHAQQLRCQQVGQEHQPCIITTAERHAHPQGNGQVALCCCLGALQHGERKLPQLVWCEGVIYTPHLQVQPDDESMAAAVSNLSMIAMPL